ncbi:GbsR/MarR family transcriptional regulator [Dokdonia genika]|uniref:GbsR/MarR family transcriptional regulator n=1 Tax=Dokdonia genika TaxID=308113 RepID=A0ABV9L717_9FLAO
MSQIKEQAQLIEQIGIGIEERLKLSPLASRIYALLILSSVDGLTFEEIRETIKASKSSTSVNINVLTQLNYITFYTKPGDRKRYFKLAKYAQLTSLEAELQKIDLEMSMVSNINGYNQKYYPEKFTNEASVGSIFHTYLLKKQELLEDVIKEMQRFRESEN